VIPPRLELRALRARRCLRARVRALVRRLPLALRVGVLVRLGRAWEQLTRSKE